MLSGFDWRYRKGMAVERHSRIESLQALRALAFFGIFFAHCEFFFNWAHLGVSVFYVMSGFLLFYNYRDAELGVSLKDSFRFAIGKIKKLYPLHIIMTFCMVALRIAMLYRGGFPLRRTAELLRDIVLNCALLQTWVPYINVIGSLNGASWYLSVTLFLYFAFPIILKTVKRRSLKSLLCICALVLPLEIVSCILCIKAFGAQSQVYSWFMYYSPIFRLGDFFAGVCLGKLYLETEFTGNFRKSSLPEVLFTALTVGVFLWLKGPERNIAVTAMHNATTAYIPIAAIWVYLFAHRDGIITRLLSNRFFFFIGNISPYAFLIHSAITIYRSVFILFFELSIDTAGRFAIVFIELGITVLLSCLYKKRADMGKPYFFF